MLIGVFYYTRHFDRALTITSRDVCETFLDAIVRVVVDSLQCRCVVRSASSASRSDRCWLLMMHLKRHTLTTTRDELVTVLEIT